MNHIYKDYHYLLFMKMHKHKHKHMAKSCCGEAHETKFYDDKKQYNFGIYKMDPSVNVMTKTKTSF